jgi:thymidylate synthase (FAD)
LDEGYVNLVESYGSDERIIEAARMSTQKGFTGWGPKEDGSAGDEKLLGYLWRNNHATPFEMAGAVLEIQAPIFVFREWHRHRTQSYNEMSARYAPLPAVDYVPTIDRLMINAAGTNRQANRADGAAALREGEARWFTQRLERLYFEAQWLYARGLEIGVPKELARLVLPVGRYSRMRASANLRNWLGFLTLRMAPQAQWEIRQYAHAVHDILAPLFPRTIGLFDEGMPPSSKPTEPK